MKNKKFFFENLIKWDRNYNTRDMPWKGEKDPYRIWISEIMLQQTRVQQGLDYYQRFIKKWPDVKSLAAASEQQVYKAWEGLGYYSRCRNLIASARHIAKELNGKFPDKYDDIIKLKGIGHYTAAAITSFAFNLPYAVVDGNVFRVLSRFFGIDTPVDSVKGKNEFTALAHELLDKKNPGLYNQAIMDFGAVVCKPAAPVCEECVLQKKCAAYNKQLVLTLPRKEKTVRQRTRFFNYFIIEHHNKLFVRKRTGNDIWQSLYEFALVETQKFIPVKKFLQSDEVTALTGNGNTIKKISQNFQQKLTHQTIRGRFFHVVLNEEADSLKKFEKVSPGQLRKLPFPKFIT
ncbi:MAG TPA: A/G-specific adenine glycosylase, partial [Chitinophagaceae bacterium]|nr:A/G-specific adenine glycosylase [Chitinophagaceae bacterium]